jgi:hypothetical protein
MCPDCKCVHSSSDPLVLVQLGFWPGSVTNVRYAFHQDLFQHWDILQKQVPGISQTSFIKSLECYSSKKGRVCKINKLSKFIIIMSVIKTKININCKYMCNVMKSVILIRAHYCLPPCHTHTGTLLLNELKTYIL